VEEGQQACYRPLRRYVVRRSSWPVSVRPAPRKIQICCVPRDPDETLRRGRDSDQHESRLHCGSSRNDRRVMARLKTRFRPQGDRKGWTPRSEPPILWPKGKGAFETFQLWMGNWWEELTYSLFAAVLGRSVGPVYIPSRKVVWSEAKLKSAI